MMMQSGAISEISASVGSKLSLHIEVVGLALAPIPTRDCMKLA
jgi:hypothetical protein